MDFNKIDIGLPIIPKMIETTFIVSLDRSLKLNCNCLKNVLIVNEGISGHIVLLSIT